MPGYKHALSHADSWAIVAHIRQLQTTRKGTINDVPAAARPDLERAGAALRGPATPAGNSTPNTGGTQ
jgi:hypothetical protein